MTVCVLPVLLTIIANAISFVLVIENSIMLQERGTRLSGSLFYENPSSEEGVVAVTLIASRKKKKYQ